MGVFGTAIVIAGTLSMPAITTAATPVVRQGTTTTYGVLAATTITNTGNTNISGSAGSDIGLAPGTSFTGSDLVIRFGADNIANDAATTAQTDLVTAFNDLGVPTATTLAAPDLAGQTILPGTYSTTAGTFENTGVFTLDAGGDATAIFIMQAESTVITGSDSTMVLANGAQACNVFWQVGSSATIGTNSTFIGHIYALTDITAATGATIYGQLLARNGQVTLDTNIIVNDSCATVTPPPAAVEQIPVPSPPQDSTITSISTAECTTTEDYVVSILGTFPSVISNVAVNNVNAPVGSWSQTPTQLEVRLPASTQETFTINIFNGRIPLLPTQVFICTTPVLQVTPEPTPTPTVEAPAEVTPEATPEAVASETSRVAEETATVTGGRLPDTATDTYTYLALGAGLIALGTGGLVTGRRAKK